MKCLLIGNYGVGNLGDELLREYFLTRFPEISWTVLSAHPSRENEVPRLPLGIRSLFTTPWWRTLSAFSRADAVVFGGGSLFTDVESAYACLLWGWHARIARFFRKPLVLAFQGVGPFRTKYGERIARAVIRRTIFLSVRDEKSAERVEAWGGIRVVKAADPVILLMPSRGESPRCQALALIPRGQFSKDFLVAAQEHAWNDHPSDIRIVSLHPDAPSEQAFCEWIRRKIDRAHVIPIHTFAELLEALRGCSLVLTQRYHGAIASLCLGIPTEIIPQAEGDKLSTLKSVDIAFLRKKAEEGEKELREVLVNDPSIK